MRWSSLIFFYVLKYFIQAECRPSGPSDAIVSILRQTFGSSWTQKLHVVYYGNVVDLVGEVLQRLPDYVPVKVIDGELELSEDEKKLIERMEAKTNDEVMEELFCPWNRKLIAPSVLFFETAELFKKHIKNIKWLGNRWFRFKHIVHAPGLTMDGIIEAVNSGFDIDNVAFLTNENGTAIQLVSSFMFTPHACHRNQLKVINMFNVSLAAWETTDFYPEKYKNFYNCSLAVARTGIISKPEVFVMLSQSFNFNMVLTDKTNLSYAEANDPNATDLIEEISPLLFEFGLKGQKIYSTPMEFTRIVVFVGDGAPLTQFEKMFLMFETEVWIAIGCTIAFWLASIQVINRMSKKIRAFVYGKNNNTPTVNMMNIFMNGGQFKVPRRNFSRYLLLLFIVWSLIIRTCYQSKLFEFLQMDLRRLVDMTSGMFYWGPEDRIKLENYTELERLDVAAESLNNISVLTDEFMLRIVHNEEYRSGVSSLNMKSYIYQAWYFSFKLFEFSPFFQNFNEKVGQIMSSGLLKNWDIIKLSDTLVVTTVKEDIGPQVLTMDQLEVAFLACCVPLVLAVVAFLMEHLKSRFDSCIRNKKQQHQQESTTQEDRSSISHQISEQL